MRKKLTSIPTAKIIPILKTAAIALLGVSLALLTHLPIPWLLGPLLAVLVGGRFVHDLYWPRILRDIAIIVVGYSIGLSFTKDALILILQQLPLIFLMTILIIAFCFALAWVVSKISGIDYPTILIGSIPGGLSQMVLLAEEIKGINVSVVTFLQVSRLMMIILFVPMLVFSPIIGVEQGGDSPIHSPTVKVVDLFPDLLFFIPVIAAAIHLFKKWKLPTPFLVGPIFAAAFLGLVGYQGPPLPSLILDTSQFMLGTYIGLLIKPDKIDKKLEMTGLAFMSGLFLLLGSFALSWILAHGKELSAATSLLSLAPGGMDQMGIIAAEIHADLSIVAGFQLFRLFFIFFVVPPFLRVFIGYLVNRQTVESKRSSS
ncbi:AbrB family transcriptional regulator [Bacillus dakarensis]|uniref:AbrB family transcriptional regulator n=1 Tax=Robertmurraya dakarensis TaxID=1926278 RepID=UPI000981D24E|nr:AbrB family transcriptional regulator [Bacillus dakarensis]